MPTDDPMLSDDNKLLKRAGKWALCLLGILAILAAVAGVSYSRRDVTPVVRLSAPPLPNPNAYDYLVSASGKIVDQDNHITYLSTPANPHEFNPLSWRLSAAQKAATLANNRAPLAEMRKGFAFPYRNPSLLALDPGPEYDAKFPTLARLILLEGYAKLARGDWYGEVNCDLDAIQIGELCPLGGAVNSRGYGSLCESIGRHDIWEAVDHLNLAQTRAVTGRLLAIMKLHTPFSETLLEEKWNTQGKLMRLFDRPDWRSAVPSMAAAHDIAVDEPSQALRFVSKQTVMSNYTNFMDELIRVVSHPYNSDLREPSAPTDPANKILVFTGMYDGVWFRNVVQESENELLAATLALHAYHLERGRYPDTLGELVPGYLPEVPTDPFAVNVPVRYRKDGPYFLLYSVGPDAADDGGKPLMNPGSQSGNWKYLPQAGSKGDMVVRINCG